MAITLAADRTPTWKWTPKICRRRPVHCVSSIRAAYRSLGLTVWSCQWEKGCDPEHMSASPRASTASDTSLSVRAMSSLASGTLAQMPVMISSVHSNSSCLTLGCSPAG